MTPRPTIRSNASTRPGSFCAPRASCPRPKPPHAIKGAIETAKRAKPGEVVVFLYSGHGLLDLSSYDAYLAGRLTNYEYPEKDIAEALKACPDIPE